jgi:glycine C-acetyltransferase
MKPKLPHVAESLEGMRKAGLIKTERVVDSPQGTKIIVGGREVINLCANNYLGLANHPEIVRAAHETLERWGYGLSSVRFICGTQSCHKQLEEKLSEFLRTEDAILYSSCFDANGGLFETLLTDEDAIISDELNHASIIDGVRLCKARRYRYKTCDMDDLRAQLRQANDDQVRTKLITTDGVFSMDGTVAPLDAICDMADESGAIVHFDDCHATGFWGATGRGTHEYRGVMGRIALTTGTFGKALGGGSGGYCSGNGELIELLRQRSRPYLFSNSLAPVVVGTALKSLELVDELPELREQLMSNTRLLRTELQRHGLEVVPGDHPIVPVMLGDATLASRIASRMLELGVYVIGFSFPVVPLGKARIRMQVTAIHNADDLRFAAEQFAQAMQELA